MSGLSTIKVREIYHLLVNTVTVLLLYWLSVLTDWLAGDEADQRQILW